MSRTATPPPTHFPHKIASPSARHASKGGSSALPAGYSFPSRIKKARDKSSPLKASAVAPMSASDVLGIDTPKASPDPMSRALSASIVDDDTSSIATSTPSLATDRSVDSFGTTLATPESTPSLSGDAGNVNVAMPQPAASPRLWVSGLSKGVARAANGIMSTWSRRREGESPRLTASPAMVPSSAIAPLHPSSITSTSPYIAPSPHSPAYVAPSPAMSPHTPMSPTAYVLTPAPEVAEMLDPQPLPPHALPPAIAHPHNMPPALTAESPNIDNPAEALRRYEWAEEQRKQVTEFARLCSQWPQSSYNLAKWGPNGCPHVQYIPQSWANPRHVVRTMQRQAELERVMCTEDTTFYTAAPRSTRSSSTDEDPEPSLYSFVSSHSSVATTVSRGSDKEGREERLCAAVWAATATSMVSKPLSTEEAFRATEQKTAAELHAAMSSPMVDAWRGEESIVSVSSAVSVASVVSEESKTTSAWASLACSTKSLSELDRMADLATTDEMDVDEPEVLASIPHVGGSHPSPPRSPSMRPSSCPAKRPLTMIADDEDKRRRVDDMVVDDSTPVFSEEPAALPPYMSASVPNLRMVSATSSGHVIKTSETHPIIISPFIPTEILSVLGKYLVTIPTEATKPLLLNSDVDVPSLLLSCAPPNQCASEAGLVGTTMFSSGQKTLIRNLYRPSNGTRQPTRLGNLLLSSCPGKRLRMDGPVKGRGPVCRDLRADMRRIKGEGVGAIVCCLDDEELALLGVPWDYYREVASDIGLDIIRLPMPDGFTPVSLQLFDAQVSLITQRYTLQGINVLVHCRGGIGRAGLTACAWAIKMGFVQPHPSLVNTVSKASESSSSSSSKKKSKSRSTPVVPANEDERQIVMSVVERVIAMIRSRRGLKAIESMEQVQFLSTYVTWLRECTS
ncbi:uncharacterized protein CcaverHIS019_0307580 [Cutaneotrichosporon cavernicola]|uniref:Tyrosine specific protein phosphatases domain-containing protein n=1 Tax=Cutaneotrichosporon cavernicola TaxID=279322 RepID=A0AA48IGZ9_9TREE|nr:uncharacterized protein CcaverHIS019_0307580 [Cutaneotrichosporon cavernicola]BEI90688.1 hypothetical protein CcaverHIS019_0307580 [Cutaneotrichosporon cavernicola]BEI98466.1 hypothetical protein CcaverHIS631_0307650 [Cutaneotrichosporon cavernicola]